MVGGPSREAADKEGHHQQSLRLIIWGGGGFVLQQSNRQECDTRQEDDRTVHTVPWSAARAAKQPTKRGTTSSTRSRRLMLFCAPHGIHVRALAGGCDRSVHLLRAYERVLLHCIPGSVPKFGCILNAAQWRLLGTALHSAAKSLNMSLLHKKQRVASAVPRCRRGAT